MMICCSKRYIIICIFTQGVSAQAKLDESSLFLILRIKVKGTAVNYNRCSLNEGLVYIQCVQGDLKIDGLTSRTIIIHISDRWNLAAGGQIMYVEMNVSLVV